jgi:endonuclease-3
MLSAQAQDAQVNKVTPGLFRRYPDIESYVHLRPVQLYPYISSIGLFRSKAKNIIGSARYISEHFCGTVPNDMDSMLMLPGVGRKTANVVLANYFGKNYGIAVDTHCITVSMRLFRYRTKNAEVIERRLMRFVPQKEWGNVNHLFIALGRDTCKARRKECGRCALIDLCPSSDLRMKKR